uniref:Uncharacterized protein n=1 Tax=Trichuris muris TaxID=70415 RepID=A0A5S6R0G8_TRIMR
MHRRIGRLRKGVLFAFDAVSLKVTPMLRAAQFDQALLVAGMALKVPNSNRAIHQQLFPMDVHVGSTAEVASPPMKVCFACHENITDQFYLHVADHCWHIQCLQCCVCNTPLESSLTCFTRNGLIFCKEDYFKQFAKRCTRCRRLLSPRDLVMRAKDSVFHVCCFTCVVCSAQLQKGDYFGLTDSGLLYCNVHCNQWLMAKHVKSTGWQEIADVPPKDHANVLIHEEKVPMRQKGRTRRKRSLREQDKRAPAECQGSSEKSSEETSQGSDQCNTVGIRPKRMRTSFKQQQLRTMRAYFQLNHNPDAKDLKHLAQKTGLTKRILQVWFQNARAKFRRSVMTHESMDSHGSTNKTSCSDSPPSSVSSAHMELTMDEVPSGTFPVRSLLTFE